MSTAQFCVGSIALTVAALLVCAQARSETPKFSLHNPPAGESYSSTSSIGFVGRVEPPIQTDVRIQLYHVLESGELLPEGGASVRLDASGWFSLTLEPRAGGWTPGTFRVVATAGSHLLRKTVDVEMIDAEVKPTPIREPKDSGVVLDFSDLKDTPLRVPVGERFRIRAQFLYGVPQNQHQGPKVTVELLRPIPLQPRPLIAQTDLALSFPVDEFHCEFESEIVAPNVAGDYDVHVAIPYFDSEGQRMEKHYDTVLTIGPRQDELKK